MRTVFNKKSIAVESTNKKYTIPEFQTVADKAAKINGVDEGAREKYAKGLADAQNEQLKAQAAKDSASTETELDAALDAENRARSREKFYKRQLEAIDFTPRMSEHEYNECVRAIDAVMSKKIAEYKRIAEKAVKEIIDAQSELIATATDADKVLEELDASANVLQVKHRYRVKRFTTEAPDVYREEREEDRDEWRRHVHRYGSPLSKMKGLATREQSSETEEANNILLAAWNAADKFVDR